MDGFSYSNIFATKGIEYLAIIAFFLLLIPFWLLLNRKRKPAFKKHTSRESLSAQKLRIPQGLFYSQNHTWTFLEKSGIAKVGLDDMLQHLTGKVRFACLKNQNERINKGDVVAEIEQNEKRLRICSPVSGYFLGVNPIITEYPETVNMDPYEQGWIYNILPSNWKAETNSLYLSSDATRWLSEEFQRFKDFLAIHNGKETKEPSLVVLQDGGELQDNTLAEMPREFWQEFQKEFLDGFETLR